MQLHSLSYFRSQHIFQLDPEKRIKNNNRKKKKSRSRHHAPVNTDFNPLTVSRSQRKKKASRHCWIIYFVPEFSLTEWTLATAGDEDDGEWAELLLLDEAAGAPNLLGAMMHDGADGLFWSPDSPPLWLSRLGGLLTAAKGLLEDPTVNLGLEKIDPPKNKKKIKLILYYKWELNEGVGVRKKHWIPMNKKLLDRRLLYGKYFMAEGGQEAAQVKLPRLNPLIMG